MQGRQLNAPKNTGQTAFKKRASEEVERVVQNLDKTQCCALALLDAHVPCPKIGQSTSRARAAPVRNVAHL